MIPNVKMLSITVITDEAMFLQNYSIVLTLMKFQFTSVGSGAACKTTSMPFSLIVFVFCRPHHLFTFCDEIRASFAGEVGAWMS